jgi:VWFA-related protein
LKSFARNLLVSLVCAATVVAQPQQPQSQLPKLSESIDVRVINIDVVVTDRQGNPVTGLTKDDFEIYENGQQKTISNFYEVRPTARPAAPATAAAPPAPSPAQPAHQEPVPENMRRRLIFYIDNLTLAPFNRNRVFKDMKAFAKENMRPGIDEAMIATFNRSMKVRTPFTRDPGLIQQTLDIIAGESGLGIAGRSSQRDTMNRIKDADNYDSALQIARTYAEEINHDLRNSVESINALMSTLAGVEGKKVLILTTEGFPMQPGREMFYQLEEISREKGWQGQGTLLEGMSFDAGSYIQSVGKTANANGITVYAVHAGGLGAAMEGASAEHSQAISYSVSSIAISNSTESLQMVAEMTGGLATINTNNFSKAFQNIARDMDSYYSLGYRSGTERVDRQRSLAVRTKNKKLVVRSRQTFVEKSTYAEMSDRVIANVLYKTKANDLHIVVKAGRPERNDDLFRVPVEVQIPMQSLTLLPQGEEYMGGFSLFIVVANKDGDLSDVAQKSHQIRVPAKQFGQIAGKYYTYALDLMMEPGLNKISVGVVDDVTNTSGFDRQQVIAQDLR